MKYLQLLDKRVIERKEGMPYLVRWNLFGLGIDSALFSIKLHKIIVSDDECLHDHPWAYISVILKGGYTESSFADPGKAHKQHWIWSKKSDQFIARKFHRPGSILMRPASWAHRLEVQKPCWTLVFTFKKIRTWGFFTARGWKKHSTYSTQHDC